MLQELNRKYLIHFLSSHLFLSIGDQSNSQTDSIRLSLPRF